MNGNGHDKSPAEIEREVEEARSNLRSTLGDIRDSLSPGQMLDQAIDYARASGGGDFVRNLGRSVRENPLPVALMGLGIGWLMTADRTGAGHPRRVGGVDWVDPDRHHTHVDGPTYAEPSDRAPTMLNRNGSTASTAAERASSSWKGVTGSARNGVSAAGEAASSTYKGAAGAARSGVSAIGETAASLQEGANRRLHDARDGITGAAGAASSYVGSAANSASAYASSAANTASHYASSAAHRADHLRHDAEARVARIAEEQPLLIGVAGLALGALVGALLPTTRTENRAFGDAADRVRDEAGRYAREGYDAALATASAVVEDTAETLKDHGVDTASVKQAAEDTLTKAADSVRTRTDLDGGRGTGGPGSGSAGSGQTHAGTRSGSGSDNHNSSDNGSGKTTNLGSSTRPL